MLRDQVKALGKSEKRFRMLADNIAQMAWRADRLGWATWYNKRWYDFTGTTWDQMQGRGWEGVVHPDHLDRVNATLADCLEQGTVWEDTIPIRAKNGEFRWFLSRALPILREDGEIECWFGTNTDVNDQRNAEEALKVADRRKDQFLAILGS